jgi:Domain of unknown function (DUF397)
MLGYDVSDEADDSRREWRRSARSYGTGNCLEVAALGQRVVIRDSKNPMGTVLPITPAQWNAFVACVRSDGLDL